MREFYTRNLVGTLIWYGTLQFDYFKYKCQMLVKEGKNFSLSCTCRKRKCTLASLIISIFIHLFQRKNFCSLRMQHLFPSILGEKHFQADVLHIKCWLGKICVSISIIQHFYTILKWIEFPSMEETILNHIKGRMGCAPLQEPNHQLYSWVLSPGTFPSQHSRVEETEKY